MKAKKIENHISLPSEEIMVHQWQMMPGLFYDACWSYKDKAKPYGRTLVFTSYCLN